MNFLSDFIGKAQPAIYAKAYDPFHFVHQFSGFVFFNDGRPQYRPQLFPEEISLKHLEITLFTTIWNDL